MAYAIEAGEPLSDALRRIAAEQVRDVLELREEGEVVARVHALRKRIKQLRALLRLVRPELGAAFAPLNGRLREAAQCLSAVRDAHVLLLVAGKLAEHAHEADREALCIVREALESTSIVDVESRITRAIDAVRSVQPLLGSTLWPLDGRFRVIGRGLQRTYRDGRRAMHKAVDSAKPAALHRWRKRTKDHWHQLQLLRNAAPAEFAQRGPLAKELSDVLGDDHDLALLHDRVAGDETLPAAARERVVALANGAQRRLQQRAQLLGEALYDCRPRAFRKDVRKQWRKWTR
jgi:CHAD domain-containing protein